MRASQRFSCEPGKRAGEVGPVTAYALPDNRAEMDRIRLLVVDDHEVARRDIRSFLSEHHDIEVVGEIGNGEEAVNKVQDLHPDVILLDISLPGISGIEAANSIRQLAPASRIIFVSQHDSPLIAKDALLTGASGYVVKSDAALDLWPAIEAVHSGHTFISRTLRPPG
jgi:DNA-binding NarL/FixJ family response regulator